MMHSKSTFAICLLCATGLSLSACIDRDKYVNYHHVTVDEDDQNQNGNSQNQNNNSTPGESGNIIKPGGSQGIEEGGENDINSNPGGSTVIEPFGLKVVTPSTGSVEGGYDIQVRGAQFSRTDRVYFGSLESPQTIFVTDYVLRAKVPAGHKGCVDVSVVRADETARVTLTNAFCYTENLMISSVEPTTVAANDTTPIVIKGSGFEDAMSIYAHSGDVTKALIDVVRNGNTIEAILPALDAGSVDILVNTSSDDEMLEGAITVLPALDITAITPSILTANTSETVTIAGTGFGESGMSVRVGPSKQTILTQTDTAITTVISPLASGCYDLVAYDDTRQQRIDRAIYVVDEESEPALLGVAPVRGPLEGSEVTLIGNLPLEGSVFFGTEEAEVVSRTAHSWTVTAPAVTAPQTVGISLGSLTLSEAYSYVSTPTASQIAPAHGSTATTVTLTGSGFDDSLRVFADQFEASDVVIKDSHTATFTMPSGSGNATISLMQNDVRYPTNLTFSYDEEASIYAIAPSELSAIGGTTVTMYGKGFTKGSSLQIDGEPLPHVEWLNPGKMLFTSRAHEAGQAMLTLHDANGTKQASKDVQFYEPSGLTTHLSGNTLEGRMNVTVLTVKTSEVIEGATVYVGSSRNSLISGTTNAEGQVYFEDDSLTGTQIIYACHPGYSCNTIQSFNARDVTIYLEKWINPTSSEQPPEEIPPIDDNSAINPIDVTITDNAKPSYITGTVTGFDKIDLDTANDGTTVRAAYVLQSQLSPYTGNYTADDVFLLFNDKDTYRLKARKGNVAVGLVCGLYNKDTGLFDARYFGVRSGLYVTNGVTLTANLDCPLPLNQTQSIKLLNIPHGENSTQLSSVAYLNLGNSGYIGGFMKGFSNNDLVIITKVPPLRGQLEGATLAMQTTLYLDNAYATSFGSYNIERNNAPVEVGPLVSMPKFDPLPDKFYYKANGTMDNLHNGKAFMDHGLLTWHVDRPEYVDFYELTIKGYFPNASYQLFWQFYLPGNATSLEFLPIDDYTFEGEEPNAIFIMLTAYKSLRDGYDFNRFSTLDTKYSLVDSSASTSLYIPWNAVSTPSPGGN